MLTNSNSRISSGLFFWGFLILAFAGSMIWAKSRDPFRRIEFKVKTTHSGKVSGITVLPKGYEKLPVVIYVHGSGGSWLTSGRELRQFAELGLAAVGFDYDQTNSVAFDEQFSAVLEYVRQQSWAVTNSICWIGLSLGAQNTLSFALKHPEAQPQLYVRLAGGWVEELDGKSQNTEVRSQKLEPAPHPSPLPKGEGKDTEQPVKSSTLDSRPSTVIRCPVLLVHGERDETFPVEDTKRLAGFLQTNGVAVTLKILPGKSHGFDSDLAVVIRGVGEYCKAKLTPNHPLPEFPILHPYRYPICILPALVWVGICFYSRRSQTAATDLKVPLTKFEIGLRVTAIVLATLAIGQTAIHLITPRLEVSERTLAVARKFLVPPKWKADFETLAGQPIWKGQKLKTLLTHVELANYTVNELINWKVDEEIYREFVLSPVIVPSLHLSPPLGAGERVSEMNWRRELWENFYPRIRKENTTEAAAEIVVRFLRERVTIDSHASSPRPSPLSNGREGVIDSTGIETTWAKQIANEKDFETIYVSALRSVGVPARLSQSHKSEFWTGQEWKSAPRPLLSW